LLRRIGADRERREGAGTEGRNHRTRRNAGHMFHGKLSLLIDRFDRSGIVAGPDELLYAHASARG